MNNNSCTNVDVPYLLDMCNKLEVSITQFVFLMIIYDKLYASLYSYEVLNSGFSKEERDDLVRRGFLTSIDTSKDSYVDSYETTDKFEDVLYSKDPTKSGSEFWNLYPAFIIIEGRKFPAKSIDKDNFIRNYFKKVGKFKEKHEKVIKALKYAVDHKMISMGIEKWFNSEQWESIEPLIDTESYEFPSDKVF